MSLGRYVGEVLTDTVVINIINKAFRLAKRVFTEEVQTKIKQKILNGKTWEDENYFLQDLAEAELPKEKQVFIREAMERAQREDKLHGTTYARNFRLMVTCRDDICPSTPGSPEVKGKPAVAATATEPAKPAIPAKPAVPGTKRPGILILKNLGEKCNSTDEVYATIVAAGLLQDGRSVVEKSFDFVMGKMLPMLTRRAGGTCTSLSCTVARAESAIKKDTQDFENRGFFAKWFKN